VGPGHRFPLTVTVQEYLAEDDTPLHSTLAIRTQDPGTSIYDKATALFYDNPSSRYAIVDSLPSAEEIVKWVKVDLTTAYGDPALRFANSLADFMDKYAQRDHKHPLTKLLKSCSKLISLIHCWRCQKHVASCGSFGSQVPVSLAASCQLLLVCKEAILTLEYEILGALEQHLHGSKGPGQENAITLWAVLWSLILMYRDRMAAYAQYDFPNTSTYSVAYDVMSATRHMYEIITAHYAALFHTSTPLHWDLSLRRNFERLGKDEELRTTFEIVRGECWNFYNAPLGHFTSLDKFLRKDIIAKEMRLMEHL